jgi:hypothetical protein
LRQYEEHRQHKGKMADLGRHPFLNPSSRTFAAIGVPAF